MPQVTISLREYQRLKNKAYQQDRAMQKDVEEMGAILRALIQMNEGRIIIPGEKIREGRGLNHKQIVIDKDYLTDVTEVRLGGLK